MNGNWIKLFSKLLTWQWYKDRNTRDLFIHCLLKANWKDGKFEGVEIKRGSFATSQQTLMSELNMTKQEIRTATKHLISTQEITQEQHPKFSVITVVNYNQYQQSNTDANTRATQEQHTSNTGATPIEEYKNIYNSVFDNICHFKLEEKCEGCVDCMKKNICQNPTSSKFLLEHSGKNFEDWDKERSDKIRAIDITINPVEPLDIELVDQFLSED